MFQRDVRAINIRLKSNNFEVAHYDKDILRDVFYRMFPEEPKDLVKQVNDVFWTLTKPEIIVYLDETFSKLKSKFGEPTLQKLKKDFQMQTQF